MDLRDLPLFAGLKSKMNFLNARGRVLAENVANSDTPDYKARDMKPVDFAKTMDRTRSIRAGSGTQVRVSHARHIAPKSQAGGASFSVETRPDPEGSVSGNRVSVETQMMKISDTKMQYQLVSTLYKKGMGLLRMAASKGD